MNDKWFGLAMGCVVALALIVFVTLMILFMQIIDTAIRQL